MISWDRVASSHRKNWAVERIREQAQTIRPSIPACREEKGALSSQPELPFRSWVLGTKRPRPNAAPTPHPKGPGVCKEWLTGPGTLVRCGPRAETEQARQG